MLLLFYWKKSRKSLDLFFDVCKKKLKISLKNNRIITTISKSKANDLAKAIIALNDNYGDKVVGIILHGSYAVNKAREDSDVDVFVLVKEKMQQSDLWKFKALLADSIDIHFSTVDYFWNINSTIHQNIMRKGLLLWVS